MALPRFVLMFLVMLAVFSVSAYQLSGSVGMTIVATIVVAVLVQVGYACIVFFMAVREARLKEPGQQDTGDVSPTKSAISRPD